MSDELHRSEAEEETLEAEPISGVEALRRRRTERTKRQAPSSRHPRPAAVHEVLNSENAPYEVSRETTHEIAREIVLPPSQAMSPAIAQPVTRSRPSRSQTPLPSLEVNLSDPTGLMVAATVLSVPGSVMRRFEVARATAASHTGLVLDALRTYANELPDLVLAERPGPRKNDLFPWRPSPRSGKLADRPEPLRVRPTVGELGIIDSLVGWVNEELIRRRPGSRRASRSEVVTAALKAYLPPSTRKASGSSR